jgi:SAM-dependent methyltransferase
MPPTPGPFATAAAHYLRGRPPYSPQLADVVRRALGLDGHGVLLDVGCGPGVLAVQLADLVADVIGIDPEPAMLVEARRHAAAHDVQGTWIEARAEDLATLDLPAPRLVTFGQSLHWTDHELVLATVHELLEPGGAVALITPSVDHGARPALLAPAIPHEEIRRLVGAYTGWSPPERLPTYADALRRSPFATAETVHAPGPRDVVRTTDEVVSNYLSMSFAAPARFGDRLDAFLTDLDAVLRAASPSGRFHDWPGDTTVIWARATRR